MAENHDKTITDKNMHLIATVSLRQDKLSDKESSLRQDKLSDKEIYLGMKL